VVDSVHRAVEQGGRGERLGADIEQVREVVMVMMVVMIMLRVVSRSVNELLLHSIEMFPVLVREVGPAQQPGERAGGVEE